MWKVKDDVDIEEVEKYGYDDLGICYRKNGGLLGQFYIDKESRQITRVHPYSLREEPTGDELYDLIQARISRKGVEYGRY